MRKKVLCWGTLGILAIICCLSSESNMRYFFGSALYGDFGLNNGNIIFSRESGFYQNDFKLKIFAPTSEIYYTLDGTEPDKNAIKYSGKILVDDASEQPNKYSMRTDVTAEFLREKVEKYCNGRNIRNYTAPEENIDKCTTIKAVYYDKDGNRSDVQERVYFVGFNEKEGYDDLGVISLVTDPDNLFGHENGIYVLGKTFEDFVKSGTLDSDSCWYKEYWQFWDANYRNKGRDWERESHIQVFDENKELVLSQNVGIRIQGGGSRGFLPKSLNIYARDEYGDNRLRYDFWGTGYYPKRMTLTNGGDDYATKIDDRLVSELSDGLNFATMNYKPYVLFLNGEYWGFYYLAEKYDTEFVEEYYGVDKGTIIEDIIMIKNGNVEAGIETDLYTSYADMMNAVSNADMTNETNYEIICQIIDIDSFIDYFAVMGYISRWGDWPDSNVALWRSRNVSEKPYEDGRWRWMLFDVNSTAMEESLVDLDCIATMRKSSPLFDNMCNNPFFRQAFAERLLELADTVFLKENVNQKIDEYVELMDIPMEKHFQRFFGTSNEKFHEGIEELRFFFDNRREYVLESIKTNFPDVDISII